METLHSPISRDRLSHERSQAAESIAALAGKCADLASQVAEENRLDRLAVITEWCVEQAERLVSDRFGDGQEPDYLADVVSAVWELPTELDGKYPPQFVMRIARRSVRNGHHFESFTESVDHPKHSLERVDVSTLSDLTHSQYDSAVIVAFRMDFESWRNSLPPLRWGVALSLADDQSIAGTLTESDCSKRYARDIKGELRKLWEHFPEGRYFERKKSAATHKQCAHGHGFRVFS